LDNVRFLKAEYEIAAALRQHIALGSYVELVADNADKASFCGFPIRMSERLLLFQLEDGWQMDGVRIFPVERLAEVIHDRRVLNRQAILDWNGIDRSHRFDWIDLTGFENLFRSAQSRGETIEVEDDDCLEVGVVQSVGAATVTLRLLDVAGAWVDEPDAFPFEEILTVSIGSRYSRVLRAYADRGPPPG